ncbi:MAG: riboflavin synthase subunit alpha [Deltaproteobacteria bacterium RIFOXYA12_FULL_61_11]|nr:MAG: riboflavin synthase subunit alpha [Deltaproteobacteria bacterium RIFOXYA12_FULL_61_11]
MFTGLIEEIGALIGVQPTGTSTLLTIEATLVLEDLAVDNSIAVNGVCQTVVRRTGTTFTVEAVAETLGKTTLGRLSPGCRVNLERALRLSDRLGGHLVLGHVDGLGTLRAIEDRRGSKLFRLQTPEMLRRYLVPQGSLAVDGVSLTLASVQEDEVHLSLIPFTLRATTLGERRPGDHVNLETDILARYIERLAADRPASTANPGLDQTWLAARGYTPGRKG